MTLPIHQITQSIIDALRQCPRLVLYAPTGSGKTTQVPQILLRSNLIPGQQRILILQPRRLATRLVAQRVAQELNTTLGQLVGYQMRFDSKLSDDSRLIFLTEGLLLRQLASDPLLTGVGAVILDEFHERNLPMDLSLALLHQLQKTRRPDLRLIVMSATLDTQPLAAYLDAPILQTQGRLHPIDIQYLPHRPVKPVWELAAQALLQQVRSGLAGDVLIFMPGAYEIRRTIQACRALVPPDQDLAFFPLHGSLTAQEQDAAVAPCSRRKVIVSTNVAQTSLTIAGVVHVIDAGQARVHRYDPTRAINALRLEPISQASATQRAGRAGRTAPGTCVRLWPENEHRHRPENDEPEIHRLDLSPMLLDLLAMGVTRLEEFPWFEPPTSQALDRARQTLVMLGALVDPPEAPDTLDTLDTPETLTELGRKMAMFPLHPRLSRMLIYASEHGCLRRATLWAALLSEQEILPTSPPAHLTDLRTEPYGSDMILLERLLHQGGRQDDAPSSTGLPAHVRRDVGHAQRQYLDLCRRAGLSLSGSDCTEDLIPCLLAAYPDHVAILKDGHSRRCVAAGHKNVELDPRSIVRQPGIILALDMRRIGRANQDMTQLGLVSQIDPAWLPRVHPKRWTVRKRCAWNPQRKAVDEIEESLFGDLVIDAVSRPQPDPDAAAPVLVGMILDGSLKLEHWDEKVEQWIARVRCVAQWFPQYQLIQYTDQDRQLVLYDIVRDATAYHQIKDRPCLPAVREALSWEHQRLIDKLAPAELPLPCGKKLKITYAPSSPPRARARIQELYDLSDSPRVAGGNQKVLLEILGPNHRPLQITDDLAGFWKNLYPTLRKELSRRYPRHVWR